MSNEAEGGRNHLCILDRADMVSRWCEFVFSGIRLSGFRGAAPVQLPEIETFTELYFINQTSATRRVHFDNFTPSRRQRKSQ